jgi:hypothetical protein
LRRAVRYGDGWHPMRLRVDWLRNEGLPQLRKIAESEGKPMPALCPNGIRFRSKTPKGLKKIARGWSAAKTPGTGRKRRAHPEGMREID